MPVLLVPTSSVSREAIQEFAQILNLSQNVFHFIVSSNMKIERTSESNIKHSPQKPAIESAQYRSALSRYITQFDYYSQVEDFLSDSSNFHQLSKQYEYIPVMTETIVIGREQFMWDEADEAYLITGVYETDGWTALYDDRPDTPVSRYNLCFISLEKFFVDEAALSGPLIRRLNIENYPSDIQRQLAQRVYLSHNIVYFLLARIFHSNLSANGGAAHEADCLMDLNYEGGLDRSLASNRVCLQCEDQFTATPLAPRISGVFSARSILKASICLTRGIQRVIKVEYLSRQIKKAAIWVLAAIALSIVTNVVASVGYDPGNGVFAGFYKSLMEKPPILALWMIGLAIGLVAILITLTQACAWVTKGSKKDIEL